MSKELNKELKMKLPVVEYSSPDRLEDAIANMLEHLNAEILLAVKGGAEDRGMRLLAELMPPFIRALEAERAGFIAKARAAALAARTPTSFMDEHLMVLVLPIVNMIGCLLVTLVPTVGSVPADTRDRVRRKMFDHIVENLIAGVTGYVDGAGGDVVKEGKRDDTRLCQ